MQVEEFRQEILKPMGENELMENLGAFENNPFGKELTEVISEMIDSAKESRWFGHALLIPPFPRELSLDATGWNPAYQIAIRLGIPFTAKFSNDGNRFMCEFDVSHALPSYSTGTIVRSYNNLAFISEVREREEKGEE